MKIVIDLCEDDTHHVDEVNDIILNVCKVIESNDVARSKVTDIRLEVSAQEILDEKYLPKNTVKYNSS